MNNFNSNVVSNPKGVIKREVAEVKVADFEVANLIIRALVDNGYELISKPIKDRFEVVGEHITIYKVEQR